MAPAPGGAPSPGRESGARERATERATVMQGDRAKAYRPIAPDLRRAALEAGLRAYAHGEYFEAHELLEPAWMGTADLAERALYQGLIKLAAGYVHAVRGNPIGFARNLRGARGHLDTSLRLNPKVSLDAGVDIAALLAEIDARLVVAATVAEELAAGRGPLIALLPGAPLVR
jgi:predicted metal-dependent hydrolase